MKKNITPLLLALLIITTELFQGGLAAQVLSLHDSARHMLTDLEANTKDKKIKAALKEAEALYTSDLITDSLAAKLLAAENLILTSTQINRKKVLPFAVMLVDLFKGLEPTEEHRAYAGSLNALGSLYERMGQYQQAAPVFDRALAVTRKSYGEEHPAYVNSLNHLATLYQTMGIYGRAAPMLQQVSMILKKVLGEESDAYINSLNRQAALYELIGDLEKSTYLYQQALALKKRK